jgi:hypothetical protein
MTKKITRRQRSIYINKLLRVRDYITATQGFSPNACAVTDVLRQAQRELEHLVYQACYQR